MKASYHIILSLAIAFLCCATKPASASCSLCQWFNWGEWNTCNATCGGGYRERSRPICCSTSWTVNQCVSSCGIQRSDARDAVACNTTCYNNGVFTNGACACGVANYGPCCENTIQCGAPSSITNGQYTGSNFNVGGTITYSCNTKYQLVDGNATHTCDKVNSLSTVGYWKGTVPRCVNVARCDSNPCKNGATCVNGLDQYTCNCASGWTGTHCEFDIQPPVYSNCPTDMVVHTSDRTANVNWTEPTFRDPLNLNNQIIVTKNYQESKAVMPWGEYVVQYVGDKQTNGLRAECNFTIKVLPYQCTPLPIPANGAFACNGWNKEYTSVCTLFCENDKTVPLGGNINEVYACGATGNWIPAPTSAACSDTRSANNINANEIHYYSNACSSNAAAKQTIQENYLKLLKSTSWKELCTAKEWADKCLSENVQVIC